MGCNTNMTPTQNVPDQSMEEYLKNKAILEDQIDYQFIQQIIQEVTQSCALNLPIPASAIPPLIMQAARWFWQNDDYSCENRYYCIKNSDFNKCGPNTIIKLPPQIIGIYGVYKTTDSFNYGIMGDFSLERMILNNSALAAGAGGSLSDVFGSGTGYNLTDVMGALYEVQTYKAMFDTPLTYSYNEFSNELIIMGALGGSNVILTCYKRLKLQDLYKNYYFFRFCVCLTLRSLGRIMGTYTFKLPGGVEVNYNDFKQDAVDELNEIKEWVKRNHTPDYFINSNSI